MKRNEERGTCLLPSQYGQIDGHFTINPVSVGGGPFILAYNDPFHRFTQDVYYQELAQQFMSEKYVKKCDLLRTDC